MVVLAAVVVVEPACVVAADSAGGGSGLLERRRPVLFERDLERLRERDRELYVLERRCMIVTKKQKIDF